MGSVPKHVIYNSVMSLFWFIIPFTTAQFTYRTPFPLPASSKPEVITHCFHINQVGYRWTDAVILTGVRLGCEFASASNYKSIYIFNIFFFKLCEFVIHNNVLDYFKFKLNPCHHGFTESKSTVTNFTTHLDFIWTKFTSVLEEFLTSCIIFCSNS